MKQTVYLALILLVVAGLFFAVGDSLAKPGQQSGRSLDTSQSDGISAITPDAVVSGVVYWDYRVGIVAEPATILTVSPGKIFVMTDLVITPMIEPAGYDNNPIDIKIYEDATLKTIIYYPKDQIHFASGIPFAPGSQVNISQPAQGGSLLGNVIFSITVSGYEYTP